MLFSYFSILSSFSHFFSSNFSNVFGSHSIHIFQEFKQNRFSAWLWLDFIFRTVETRVGIDCVEDQ